ncbi:MAG: hypothetical protein HC860_15055 [Alkalinema sp. RU_4_3]|nr:hypothetical protein [Alkalinema sp. RU_4_3]
MEPSRAELRELLERTIFDDTPPQEWLEDVWALNPTTGEMAGKLLETFECLIVLCPESQLQGLVKQLYQRKMILAEQEKQV